MTTETDHDLIQSRPGRQGAGQRAHGHRRGAGRRQGGWWGDGHPTPGAPTSPAGGISPAGDSITGARACRQWRPTSVVTWSIWWNTTATARTPQAATAAARRLGGHPAPTSRPLVKATMKRLAGERGRPGNRVRAWPARPCDQRQLVLPFPLPHRKNCELNRRPTAHCGLHRPQLQAVRPASAAERGRM